MDQNAPSITGVFWFHFVFPFPTFVKGPNKMISTYVVLHARGFSQRQKENKSFKLSLERPLKSHAWIGPRLSPTSLPPENQPQIFCIPRWDWLLQVYIQLRFQTQNFTHLPNVAKVVSAPHLLKGSSDSSWIEISMLFPAINDKCYYSSTFSPESHTILIQWSRKLIF